MVVSGEGSDQTPSQCLGRSTIAGVERWLAAAGLRSRDGNDAAGVLEQLDCRKADRWAEQIHQTGDEQGDVRLVGHAGDGVLLQLLRQW